MEMETNVRDEVAWFARQMEAKLRENDHKGGWDDCDALWLMKRAKEELSELAWAMNYSSAQEIIREAADVANFCMMIADKARKFRIHEKAAKGR